MELNEPVFMDLFIILWNFLKMLKFYVLQFEIANQAKVDWLDGYILMQYGNIDSGIKLN